MSSGVSLDSIVIAFQQGHSVETIQQLYPALSLAGIQTPKFFVTPGGLAAPPGGLNSRGA
jgi:uncharacterized protein (DUF433 family)